MEFRLRDKNRYGQFEAESNKGIVIVDIFICGFGEKIEVYQDERLLESVDTLEEDYDCNYEEDDNRLVVGDVSIQKPFLKTLKRY